MGMEKRKNMPGLLHYLTDKKGPYAGSGQVKSVSHTTHSFRREMEMNKKNEHAWITTPADWQERVHLFREDSKTAC